MKKPTEKRVAELLKNIELNFSELINCIIYYDKKDMDDWASDIIGYIEDLPEEDEIHFLLKDLAHRKNDDFDVYGYQRLWWSAINVKSDFVIDSIVDYIKTSDAGMVFKNMLLNWTLILADGIYTKANILFILAKSNQPASDQPIDGSLGLSS